MYYSISLKIIVISILLNERLVAQPKRRNQISNTITYNLCVTHLIPSTHDHNHRNNPTMLLQAMLEDRLVAPDDALGSDR